MHSQDFFNRRTGRTTRMLQDAIKMAVMGHAVYVLCGTEQDVINMKDLVSSRKDLSDVINGFKHDDGSIGLNIKFESFKSIGGSEMIDWNKSKLINAHPSCKLLIDHRVYECQFGELLENYHLYDLQTITHDLIEKREKSPKKDIADFESHAELRAIIDNVLSAAQKQSFNVALLRKDGRMPSLFDTEKAYFDCLIALISASSGHLASIAGKQAIHVLKMVLSGVEQTMTTGDKCD